MFDYPALTFETRRLTMLKRVIIGRQSRKKKKLLHEGDQDDDQGRLDLRLECLEEEGIWKRKWWIDILHIKLWILLSGINIITLLILQYSDIINKDLKNGGSWKTNLPTQLTKCRSALAGCLLLVGQIAISDSDVPDLDLEISIHFLVEFLSSGIERPHGSSYVLLPSKSFTSLFKDL